MDVVITVGGKGMFVLLSSGLVVLAARLLGPAGQGTFAVSLSLLMVLVQMGSLGLAVSAPYFAAREPDRQRAIAFTLLRIGLWVSLALCAATATAKAVAPGILPGITWPVLLVTLGGVPAAIGALYLQGVLLGQQRAVPYNMMEIVQVASTVVALAALAVVAHVDVIDVVLLTSLGRYVALLLALVALRGVLWSAAARSVPGLARRLLERGGRIYLVTFLSFALIRLDLLLVNALLGAQAAGQYSIASYVTEALIVVPSVASNMLLPRLARAADPRLTPAAFRAIAALWALICLASLPGALIAIPLVFGGQYGDAVGLYAWLAAGTFCIGMLSMLVVHFVVTGYPRALVAVWAVGLVINVILNLALLAPLGVTAAPIISSVTYALVFVAHLRVFARESEGLGALWPRVPEVVGTLRAAFGR